MIDFTSCEVNKFRAYGGVNGNKINILYEGSGYMLKFPPVPSRNKEMSYTNGCISEYAINKRIYTFPASSIEENGKKISCFEFLSSLKSTDCTAALKRVSSRIDMEEICTIIDETPALLPV